MTHTSMDTRKMSRRWPYLAPARVPGSMLALWIALMGAAALNAEDRHAGTPSFTAVSIEDAGHLIARGDVLAADGRYKGALALYKRAYEAIVADIRGLPFLRSIDSSFLTRDQLKEKLRVLLKEEMPDEKLAVMDRALKAFQLIPEDLQLELFIPKLYLEEIAGFYEPDGGRIYLISDYADAGSEGLLDVFRIGGHGFDPAQQRVALAHEMAHGLADQHFDLKGLLDLVRDDDDMALAVTSLIEGEATMVMFAETMRARGEQHLIRYMDPRYVDGMFGLLTMLLPFAGGRTYRSAPDIFKEGLIFPYAKGMVFTLHLTNKGDWTRVNQAFRDPPLSSEQILHPAKYTAERDVPLYIHFANLDQSIPSRWTHLGGNVLGEFQLSILLEGHGGKNACSGWDGDRYEVFEDDEGRVGLVWMTTWDSEADAVEFAQALVMLYRRRAGLSPLPAPMEEAAGSRALRETSLYYETDEGRAVWIQRKNQEVALVQNFSAGETEMLRENIWDIEKKEKRIPPWND